MIIRLSQKFEETMQVGNKARFLMEMTQQGFPVPGGFVFDGEEYRKFLKSSRLENFIESELSRLTKENVSAVSASIREKILASYMPVETEAEMCGFLSSDKKYAVRSSGAKEDLNEFSFAGQYESFLNVSGMEEIAKAVVKCYASAFSETVLGYMVNHGLDMKDFYMGVVVQEMVASEQSGVAFTIDPVSGRDTVMLIEAVEGLGELLVSGQVSPEQYYFDWYRGYEVAADGPSGLTIDIPEKKRDDKNAGKGAADETAVARKDILSAEAVKRMAEEFLRIQLYFGYPCDIEWAMEGGKLYILQARRITSIRYAGYEDAWSTADFKDGGVSASICTPYMWSLYEYIWEYSARKFVFDSKIIFERDMHGQKLGDMFFGRPYWNLSFVKLAMSRVIGYKEREFDSEYGIQIHYEGDGHTTGITPKSLFGILRMAIAQNKILKDREENAQSMVDGLLHTYETRKEAYDGAAIGDIRKEWYTLTHDEYLKSESTYFLQIFINTVHQSIYKDSLLKYVSEGDYLTMLSCIENISHLRPFYEIWEISRKIRKNKKNMIHWKETSSKDLAAEIASENWEMPAVRHLISEYGYHSDKELDVTYPCYFEDCEPYIIHIKNTVLLDDSFSPDGDKEKGRASYEKIFEDIQKKVSAGKYTKIRAKVDKMRDMLWWREEFRDVSTRFYYLIRVYTLELAKALTADGTLEKEEDIWFLKVGMLWDYLDGKCTAETLRETIAKNRTYYDSFHAYMSENEIGSMFTDIDTGAKAKGSSIKGLGANNGQITGTARVIEDFSEIERLREGEILVTRFTDTGWTPKFAILKGIVTEYGGILCHAAIVSREYGIPAVVACKDAMKYIKDGQTITIDGTTGEVFYGD